MDALVFNPMATLDALPPQVKFAPVGAPSAFQRELEARDAATDRTAPSDEQTVRRAIEQLVAQALVLPLLKQVRQDPFKTPLMHGGMGENMFGAQLDQILADRLTGKANLPIVEAAYQQFSRVHLGGAARGSVDQHG